MLSEKPRNQDSLAPLSGFENAPLLNTLMESKEALMNKRTDLVGKTISGIVAVPTAEDGPVKIWMIQFTDGTHVEFVSPGARRTLDRLFDRPQRSSKPSPASPQLVLNVA